jgi:hypothetical protein
VRRTSRPPVHVPRSPAPARFPVHQFGSFHDRVHDGLVARVCIAVSHCYPPQAPKRVWRRRNLLPNPGRFPCSGDHYNGGYDVLHDPEDQGQSDSPPGPPLMPTSVGTKSHRQTFLAIGGLSDLKVVVYNKKSKHRVVIHAADRHRHRRRRANLSNRLMVLDGSLRKPTRHQLDARLRPSIGRIFCTKSVPPGSSTAPPSFGGTSTDSQPRKAPGDQATRRPHSNLPLFCFPDLIVQHLPDHSGPVAPFSFPERRLEDSRRAHACASAAVTLGQTTCRTPAQ